MRWTRRHRGCTIEYVTSADGTRIAFERTGNGPPLVLVHGSINDRRAWGLVVPTFAQQFTVMAMDRRGRGESGPTAEHQFERQIEDVLAVMKSADEPIDLIGHSYGAHCALGAAAMAPDLVKHLVLYEPPPIDDVRMAVVEAFERETPSDAIGRFLTENLRNPPERVEAMKQTPVWSYLTSFAATVPSEGRALMAHGFDPAKFAHLLMPVLFLQGSETAERLGAVLRQLEPYMPQAEWVTFEGQGHGATMMAPQLFSDTVIDFLRR